jgi:hypothetical protein
VLDAAAVDAKRRLVLIRRDNVEHLIMIGGPTDIVIETGIGADRVPQIGRAVTPAQTIEEPIQKTQTPDLPTAALANQQVAPALPASTPVERAAAPVRPEPVTPARPLELRRPPAPSDVSAMGSVLYDEEREPFAGADMASAVKATVPASQPINDRAAANPFTEAAENVLDQARARVLTPQIREATIQDSTQQLVAKLEAAKLEAARRTKEADAAMSTEVPLSQPLKTDAFETQSVIRPQAEKTHEPSDFEKLLEAELQAGGLVEPSLVPEVSADLRFVPTRERGFIPPVTGATPDHSLENEMARMLGELELNRKTTRQ